MEDQAISCMMKGLEGNKSLIELDISGNEIGTGVLMSLMKIISGSKISQLSLKNLRLSTTVLGKIDELMRDRPDIKIIA